MIRYIHKRRYRGVSLRNLQERYPDVSREILYDLLLRWRAARARRVRRAAPLSWTEPVTVWAVDFTEADFPVDGIYRYILYVRDLGSGFVLFSWPCRKENTDVVVRSLDFLFRWYGPPLVLKSDNGSAFRAKATRRLLSRFGVVALPSPPRCPRYNGACEAGIGSLKRRILDVASRDGHPFAWTSQDLRAAREWANAEPSPGPGPSPRALFEGRSAVSRRDRLGFLRSYRSLREEERIARALLPQARPGARTRAAVVRAAVRRALEAHGLLVVKRRWIRPGVSS